MLRLLLVSSFISKAICIMCYNCSASHKDWISCGEGYARVDPAIQYQNYKKYAINCTKEENSLCFVRSWSSRERHSWLVQRGCYALASDDPLLTQGPLTRVLCKAERLPEAEFSTCFCQSDWCNTSNEAFRPKRLVTIIMLLVHVFLTFCVFGVYVTEIYANQEYT